MAITSNVSRDGRLDAFRGGDAARYLGIIAISYFALAAIVAVDAVRVLAEGEAATHAVPGIVVAAMSLAIMPVLSWAQRRARRESGSRTAEADSKQTLLCTYLSAVLLAGPVLNGMLGWWWAEAGAALIIAGVAVGEGRNAWRGVADLRRLAGPS